MAAIITKKDEMVEYIDSNPNERITAPVNTIFWRHDLTYYTIHPVTNVMTKIDAPFIKDKKYEVPFYKGYKFIYSHLDECWIKLSNDSTNTGWMFLRYAPPTTTNIGGTVPPVPPVPPTPPSPCCSGSTFCGIFTGSFIIENVIGSNLTGSFYIISGSTSGSGSGSYSGLIGLPTDGYYGNTPDDNAAGIEEGDRVEDAFDKVDVVLGKLIPPRPPKLSTKTLTIPGSYSARRSGLTDLYTNVCNTPSPLIQLAGGMVATNAFTDGDVGALSAICGLSQISQSVVGVATLTTGSDVGTYGQLQITSDVDYYAGQTGKQGFWNVLLAQMYGSTIPTNVGPWYARLVHSTSGATPYITFYVDSPPTPSNLAATVFASGVNYISGVPALVGGTNSAMISFSGSANNTIGNFYNATQIFTFGGTGVSTTSLPLPIAPSSGSLQSTNGSVLVNDGAVTENASFTLTAYNSAGGTTSHTISNTRVRMDSALESRVKSGVGEYPTTYGSAFDKMETLTTVGNEELQFLNGQFQYPTGNYTTAVPVAGPDYTSVPTGSYQSMRWTTINLGSGTSFKNVQLTFNGDSGTFNGGGLPMSNFKLYVRVDGSIPSIGWVDGNAAYAGIGNPTNNGEAALAVNTSAPPTIRVVTFGTAIKTGNVIVRVGIPEGSSRKFGSISMTLS